MTIEAFIREDSLNMIRLLYGISNSAKIQHMEGMIDKLGIEVVSLNDVGNPVIKQISEIGNDPLENARIKAMSYYIELKMPVFSCDSGLYNE